MIRFGTGGWRAVIGEDFARENVRRVAARREWSDGWYIPSTDGPGSTKSPADTTRTG